jgi:S-sulfo-L-cysteine synthase (3-phospho-L-serine-dependent)
MSAWFALVESNTSGTGRLLARAVRTAGYRPVLLAADPGRYPYAAADGIHRIRVDTADGATVLATCKELADDRGLAGVLSSSEYFIETAALIAMELGRPGPAPEAVRRCRDKGLQRRALAAAGVRIPRFREVTSAAAASAAADELRFPVVVKPVSGSGNVGVRVCATHGEVTAQAEFLLAQTHNERGIPLPGRVLVEEYVPGPEFSCEVMSGEYVGLTSKHLGPPPFPVEIGHDYPAALPHGERDALRSAALAAVHALDLTWGATHVEVRLGPRGPSIIEVNPRLAGGFIPELVRLADGVDLITELVAAAVGAPRTAPPRQHTQPARDTQPRRSASIRFLLASSEGRLIETGGVHRARDLPGVVEAAFYVEPGVVLTRHGDFRDRIGHVIACAADPPGAAAAAETGLAQLTVTVGGQG